MSRRLRPEERELWDKVKDSANPMRPQRKTVPDFTGPDVEPAPSPAPTSRASIPQFRIGSQAKRSAIPMAQPAKPQIPTMDPKTFGKMTRGRLAPEATLDLHGMTVSEAHPELINFVLMAAQRQMRLVLVITGKGRDRSEPGPIPGRIGVLKQSLPMWLRQAPLNHVVMDTSPAHQKHGGGGAFYVYLRRRR